MASQFTTPSKVTSPGSQYSVSASDAATVPNPTPLTEALDSEVVDPPPEIDFHAMTKILAPIAESLNEAAEEAMYPTPPINTPAVTSPATSVVYRYPYTRSRGLSTIGDRLARAMAEGRNFHHDSDIMSNSGRSIRSSVPADDESDSMSDLRSDGGMDRHDIPIALGSPRINPMGLISFTSNDLADRPPVPFNSTDIIESASPTGIGSGSHHPDSAKSFATGVTEMSTWKEEVEGRFVRALKCLENLAHDEHQLDPSKPMEHYYEAHLKRLMGGANRKVPVSVELASRTQ
ncbi:hypothetical protein BU25DRAFT_488359 [Macroventuria anomochaeta]|uniref:Uncharacterized protein n=1 Tax=Macroventuria anomochaeta TaxID=301207 RepID=A0ACB6SCV4_9PLEO|nr:uncharacterized protein BU25DRAFT_488359 [Macroventuria anomochaeta]KAF2631817.1 hypothetical protein BU25DRAFT_488359 [Macroventuria anomochaeta]